MLDADPATADVRRDICGKDTPSLAPENEVHVDLPDYAARLKMNARDPHAVVSGFRVCIYVILPRCLGYRMCPNCPRCNAPGSSSPC